VQEKELSLRFWKTTYFANVYSFFNPGVLLNFYCNVRRVRRTNENRLFLFDLHRRNMIVTPVLIGKY